jgi:hypothetical protein
MLMLATPAMRAKFPLQRESLVYWMGGSAGNSKTLLPQSGRLCRAALYVQQMGSSNGDGNAVILALGRPPADGGDEGCSSRKHTNKHVQSQASLRI